MKKIGFKIRIVVLVVMGALLAGCGIGESMLETEATEYMPG